ncbi:hypothetical protein POVWA2_045600 [Plasmodium ovale wallikeri]|uniref:Uncharacterized protein n=1 Tax=Plasmodium ovale wallikeri TaxID=864142 RepID=A0A1A8ZHE9_PLAOA|nr:hypothetical protein POVWA1_046720 [Plasmodium ovale wallikeri]SBT43295.1 hypothetical protein POVWA2_045600 [Plasmodium ovale wallikeri]
MYAHNCKRAHEPLDVPFPHSLLHFLYVHLIWRKARNVSKVKGEKSKEAYKREEEVRLDTGKKRSNCKIRKKVYSTKHTHHKKNILLQLVKISYGICT